MQEKGPASGPHWLWLRDSSCTRVGWPHTAGLASLLGQGAERPGPGELGGVTGPQPLAGVASGQLQAVFCGLRSHRALTSPRPASSFSGQWDRGEETFLNILVHYIHILFSWKPKPGFPENQRASEPLKDIGAGTLGVWDQALKPQFPSSRTTQSFQAQSPPPHRRVLVSSPDFVLPGIFIYCVLLDIRSLLFHYFYFWSNQ